MMVNLQKDYTAVKWMNGKHMQKEWISVIFSQESKSKRLHLVYFFNKNKKPYKIYCSGKYTYGKSFIKFRRLKYKVRDDSYHLGKGKNTQEDASY